MVEITIIGLDLAKKSFQVHGASADGTVVFRKKLSRGRVLKQDRSGRQAISPGRLYA